MSEISRKSQTPNRSECCEIAVPEKQKQKTCRGAICSRTFQARHTPVLQNSSPPVAVKTPSRPTVFIPALMIHVVQTTSVVCDKACDRWCVTNAPTSSDTHLSGTASYATLPSFSTLKHAQAATTKITQHRLVWSSETISLLCKIST